MSGVIDPSKILIYIDKDRITTMFAIIRTGGKQYKVQKDDTIRVEKLEGKAGDTVSLGEVLFMSDGKSPKLGEPTIKGASVSAKVVEQTRGEKIIVFKKKRRQNYRRKNGHRQDITVLKITDIKAA
jgi:large subunit ribosomal protein L21